jgi:hypothetical protein
MIMLVGKDHLTKSGTYQLASFPLLLCLVEGTATYFGRVFHVLFFGFFLSCNYLLDLSYFSVAETHVMKERNRDYFAFTAAASDLRKDSVADLNGATSFVLDLVGHFDSENVGT